jgi:hypothetical protein
MIARLQDRTMRGPEERVGIAGERGTIGGRRSCDMTKLLEAALATVSVLASPTSSRSFMASWG